MVSGLRVRRGIGALAGVLALGAVAPRHAWASNIVISDGTFSTWKFGSYVAGTGNPTATINVDTSQGSPAPALENTTAAGTGGTAGGYGYDAGTPINADLNQAKFTLTIQMKSGAGDRGLGQDIHLLVVQDGGYFISYRHRTTGEARRTWKTVTFHGRLVDKAFNNLYLGASGPNFKNPKATAYFGLYAQNSDTGEIVRDFYDNYTLIITPK